MNMYKCGINNPVYYPFFYTVLKQIISNSRKWEENCSDINLVQIIIS